MNDEKKKEGEEEKEGEKKKLKKSILPKDVLEEYPGGISKTGQAARYRLFGAI